MGQPPSDRELKRMGRVLAGHRTDKDRARWKRKVKGEAGAKPQPRKTVAQDDDVLEELEDSEDEAPR
jgi:hypothetical protein